MLSAASIGTVLLVSDDELLSPQQQRTWLLVVGVMMWLPVELDAHLERVVGLSHAEYGVLRCLSVLEDREVHMSRLAATASVTPSHLSRVVARLEKRGWLTRSNDPGDARRTLARLTDEGASLVARTEPEYAALVRRCVFAHLGQEQAAALEDIAEALLVPLRADCVQLLAPRSSPSAR
jgi:DNA-binding MarR family transcriptional regulator